MVNVPSQPRHASLMAGKQRSTSGSFAMLAAILRASSHVSSLAADWRPGPSSGLVAISVRQTYFR